jgi:16S rRNA (adenine1518-N6/adenine1519-N6)-dimethyltransferase
MRRHWGQNFLVDHDIADRIVNEAAIESDNTVIEIGPGRGILTGRLAEKACSVVAIEIDSKLSMQLTNNLKSHGNIEIINEDFLELDYIKLLERVYSRTPHVKVVSNLPYNAANPIIMKVLKVPLEFKPMECVFMLQEEVARRISAKPGNGDYGFLTAAVQYYSDVAYAFKVSSKAFIPEPEVYSAVIRLIVRKESKYKVQDEKLFFAMVKNVFSQRRKKFYNSISNTLGIDKDIIHEIMDNAGIQRDCRPETLSIEQFAAVANLLKENGLEL